MALDEYKKQIANLSINDQKLRNLYLRKLALGELQGPPTVYASLDKPWLKYYEESQVNIDYINKTAYRFMYDENQKFKDDVSIIFLGKKIKYKELFKKIDEVAKSLKSIGVNKGDTVTICMPNIPESAYLFYACSKIGAIADFIDPREHEDGLRKYLDISNPKNIVMLDMCVEYFKNLIKEKNIKNVIITSPLESLPKIVSRSMLLKDKITNSTKVKEIDTIKSKWINEDGANVMNFSEFIKKGKKYNGIVEEPYESNRPVAIVHTGGTTGIPKGVLLSNDNLNELTNQFIHSDMPFKRHYLSFGIMPEFVGYGLSVGLHTALVIGMKDMMIPKFEPKKMPEMILKYKPNVLAGAPAHWETFAKSELINKENIDLSFFKSPAEGGDTLNINIEKKVNEILEKHGCNVKLQKGYGMTEKCSAATVTFNNEVNKIGGVGVPFLLTNVCIYNEDKGELGYNEVGEICINAPDVMLEYYNNKEETDKVLKVHEDGKKWLHSGDLGYITDDGLLFVVGRIKDIIIKYNGVKLYPLNVESVLVKNPIVKTISIVGVSDPDHYNGEIPIAFLSLNGDIDEKEAINNLNNYAMANFPPYYVPHDYIVMDELPKTKVGKVDKRKLKEMYLNSNREKMLKK